MFDLKPIKRNECMYKRSKYDILLDEFEEMNVEGKAYSVAGCIRNAIKRNHKDHIEVYSRGDTVYLFNTILEGREE